SADVDRCSTIVTEACSPSRNCGAESTMESPRSCCAQASSCAEDGFSIGPGSPAAPLRLRTPAHATVAPAARNTERKGALPFSRRLYEPRMRAPTALPHNSDIRDQNPDQWAASCHVRP